MSENKEKKGTKQILLNLDWDLYEEFENYRHKKKIDNKSEALRHMIKKVIKEEQQD